MKRLIVISAILLVLPCISVAGTLPDTGQTKCYDDLGNEIIPCPTPDEDFYGQDAQYGSNLQSYTKLDENGNDLPVEATEWVMVQDNVTELIWEVKTDDSSIHDKDNTYTWYNSNPETNGGDCLFRSKLPRVPLQSFHLFRDQSFHSTGA